MISLIVEGLLFGLTLSVLLGPIFIALTQTAIEKGGKAGMTVGLGVWVSDLIIISVCYAFINLISNTVEGENFKFWLGIAGGIVLMIFGIGAFIKKIDLNAEGAKHSYKSYAGFFIKGFAVNTINPFTFIFWISVISTYVIGRQIDLVDTATFLSTIMATVIVTDALKVLLAKLIRNKLTEKNIQVFTKVAGVGLFLFGVFLIFRVM